MARKTRKVTEEQNPTPQAADRKQAEMADVAQNLVVASTIEIVDVTETKNGKAGWANVKTRSGFLRNVFVVAKLNEQNQATEAFFNSDRDGGQAQYMRLAKSEHVTLCNAITSFIAAHGISPHPQA